MTDGSRRTQFKKGAPPGPGRPVGSSNKSTIRAHAAQQAGELMANLLSKAHNVIDESLVQVQEVAVIDPMTGEPEKKKNGELVTKVVGGDPKVAMWVIDRLMPKDGIHAASVLNADLKTIGGVIDAAEGVIKAVLEGIITLESGEKTVNLLLRYAQMRSFEDIDSLKTLIDDIQGEARDRASFQNGNVPSWGGIAERIEQNRLIDAEPANVEPAE